jgi:hypothetical protein
MPLTDAQQERYARHLLLDELGGEGQERLLEASVRVRGSGRFVRWAARYLAASGIGTLVLDDPAAAAECRVLSPDVQLPDPNKWRRNADVDLDLAGGRDTSSDSLAEQGAAAAMRAVRELSRQ